MVKTFFVFFILIKLSFSQEINVSFYLSNDKKTVVEGEFLGTYMGYVHVLTDGKTNYFSCKEINKIILKNSKKRFSYDCNKNTLSAEILFPPKLDPMTGEWIQDIPKVFDPNFIPTKKKVTNEKLREGLILSDLENKSLSGYKKNNQKEQISLPEVKSRLVELVKTSEVEDFIFLTKKEIISLIQEELKREELKRKIKKYRLRRTYFFCSAGYIFFLLLISVSG